PYCTTNSESPTAFLRPLYLPPPISHTLSSPTRPVFLFLYNDTATTEIYTLSLHDALPISEGRVLEDARAGRGQRQAGPGRRCRRSEEHTSELQSRGHLVCRLLLEKKKKMLDCCGIHNISSDIESIVIKNVNESHDGVVNSD